MPFLKSRKSTDRDTPAIRINQTQSTNPRRPADHFGPRRGPGSPAASWASGSLRARSSATSAGSPGRPWCGGAPSPQRSPLPCARRAQARRDPKRKRKASGRQPTSASMNSHYFRHTPSQICLDVVDAELDDFRAAVAHLRKDNRGGFMQVPIQSFANIRQENTKEVSSKLDSDWGFGLSPMSARPQENKTQNPRPGC